MATGLDLGYSDHPYIYKPTRMAALPNKSSPTPPSMPESSYPTPRNSSDAGGSIETQSRSRQLPTMSIPKPPVLKSLPTMPKSPISPDSPLLPTPAAVDLSMQITAFVSGLHQGKQENGPSLFHNVSLKTYDEISNNLERYRVRHSFDVKSGKLTVYCGAGPMHEAIAAPFVESMNDLSRQLRKIHPSLKFESSGATTRSLSRNGEFLGHKMPDGSFEVISEDEHAGMIVVEIGVSETTDQLLQDAREWLWWTEKTVRLAIIVDIKKPKSEEDQREPTAWNGYYEVYARDDFMGGGARCAAFPDDPDGNESIFCIAGPVVFLPVSAGSGSAESPPVLIDKITIPLQHLLTPREVICAGVPGTNTLCLAIDRGRLFECAGNGILTESKEKEKKKRLKRGREVDDANDATYRPGQEEIGPKRKAHKGA